MAVTYKYDKNTFMYIYRYDSTSGTFSTNYSNYTAFDYFSDTAVVGDILYIAPNISNEYTWDSILFYIGTAMAGTGITIVPEYWNNDTSMWDTVVDYEDETQQFTQTGARRFYWDITKQTGWNRTTVNGVNKPWIRFRISALTTITEGGAQSTQTIYRGQDRIQIADYTSTTPATLADLYSADKAATFDLKVRTGITAADGSAVNNVYSLRPADECIMGGSKNDLYIVVTNFTGFTDATIQVSGLSEAGTFQTENITITADGTYNLTKLWTTLNTSQVTAVTGTGSFDYTVTQGQWGLVWNEDNTYQLDRPLAVQNTYLEDTSKVVIVNESAYHNGAGVMFLTKNETGGSLSYVTFGAVIGEADKTSGDGIQFFLNNTDLDYTSFFTNEFGHLRLYSCTFTSRYQRDVTSNISTSTTSASSSRIWNCTFMNNFQCNLRGTDNNTDVYNIFGIDTSTIIRRPDGTTTAEKLTGNKLKYAVWFQTNPGFARDVWGRNVTNAVRVENVGFADTYAVDFDVDNWAINWSGTNSGTLYRQNSLKFKVISNGGTGVPNVRLKFTKPGETTFEALTNSDGDIVDSTFTRIDGTTTSISTGKLIDSSATFITDGIRKGQYVFNKDTFKFSYVVSVDSETQITLRDDIFTTSGDTYFIDECILTYGTYDPVNGSVIQNSDNWKIQIIRSGYKTHEHTLTLDKKKDLVVKLERPTLQLSNYIKYV